MPNSTAYLDVNSTGFRQAQPTAQPPSQQPCLDGLDNRAWARLGGSINLNLRNAKCLKRQRVPAGQVRAVLGRYIITVVIYFATIPSCR